jgi:DNA-directed RNA polymerase beta subunit/intein/homing endonuclease
MFNPVVIRSENDYVPEKQKYFLEIMIHFTNLKLHQPQIHENNGATKTMYPQEARLRNFTYSSNMTLDFNIKYSIRDTEDMETPKIFEKVLPNINIGKLPIMLKSEICVLNQQKNSKITGECDLDCGGYFIIKGSEKTILGQERAAENRIYCFDGKNTTKWNWYAEIKSVPDFKCISPKQTEMMIANKNNGFGNGIYIQIPRIKQPIELFVLFRAFGVLSDKQICKYIVLDIENEKTIEILDFLKASIIDGNKYMTMEDSLRHITSVVAYTNPLNMDKETGMKKKREFTIDVLNNDLFPHCHTLEQKLYLVGYMAKRLIETCKGWILPDDRDSYVNKRIELPGTLLNNLFRNYFNKLVKEMQKLTIREINGRTSRSMKDYENIINMTNIYKLVKSSTIENGINRALATGDFSIKQSNSSKVGVGQVLNRLTYPATLSHLRRINTPLEKSGELIAPRKLHNTTWGFCCCLTGDADILLSNRMETKKIKDIKDGNSVNTVHRESLMEEPSTMYNFFSVMPEKLYEITTISGRKIKATGDHPFLIERQEGTTEGKESTTKKYEMKKADELTAKDKVIIRHTVKHIEDTHTTKVFIKDTEVLECYRMNLLEAHLLNVEIPTHKLKIIARLMGALNPIKIDNELYKDSFYLCSVWLESRLDSIQLMDDIKTLGFHNEEFTEEEGIWELSPTNQLLYFIMVMNGLIKNRFPDWLLCAEPSIKREFLSGLTGASVMGLPLVKSTDDSYQVITQYTIYNENLKENTDYLNQVIELFKEFGVHCVLFIDENKIDENKTDVSIIFERTLDNLNTYYDIIYPAYNERKRIEMALTIENWKIFQHTKNKDDIHLYDLQCFVKENGCVSVPVESIREVEPEMVYDFTTYSQNHSFVASSFVVSNCVETPEGQSIGIVKSLAYMAHITIPTNSSPLYDYIIPKIHKIEEVDSVFLIHKVKVFINGSWVGVSTDPQTFYQELKEMKYSGIINIYTSIVFDYKNMEIRVCSDGGRLTRPLLRVKDNQAIITLDIIEKVKNRELQWNDLLTNCHLEVGSVIEYIDVEEQGFAMIALKENAMKESVLEKRKTAKYNYTHCEIHPSTILGVLASCIPFPENNQAPRNTYECAQIKQAIGVYALNYDKRMDKTAYVMSYPSRPLVDTRLMNFIQMHKAPSGCQIHVAIMTHSGYNQEDSLLINKGSIDRGMFMSTIYHTEKDEDKNIIRDEIIRCKPDKPKTKGIKFGNYEKLNSQGFIPENTLVENRDVIIAKIIPIKENRNDPTKVIKYEDQSKIYRTTEESYIDKNYTGRNGDGYNFAKTRVRILRKPVIGDKFSSKMGQKGTCGNIIPECDMPFTKDGIRPDLILNPHAIPSRMTIGQLKETILGKVLIEMGLMGDGTAFSSLNVQTICEQLQSLGYHSQGNEIMYDGLTGEQMEVSTFFGPVYYQRLKHMVNDKQHSRAFGPMVNLTRQPAEGRSRDGGFRVGEMERDVLLAHGMSRFTKERLHDVSDAYSAFVCRKCGMIASYNNGDNKRINKLNDHFTIHHCNTCNNMTEFAKVEIPYAYKLLSQELQTINIVPRIITE